MNRFILRLEFKFVFYLYANVGALGKLDVLYYVVSFDLFSCYYTLFSILYLMDKKNHFFILLLQIFLFSFFVLSSLSMSSLKGECSIFNQRFNKNCFKGKDL